MADQLRWFKVWTSLLVDMDARPAEDIGHWVRLGCRIALVGHRGTVHFEDWEHVAMFLHVSLADVKTVLNRLPNLHVEEGRKRYGQITVTMKNWLKYQMDSTAALRMKTLRLKTRGDETRGDETRLKTTTTPLTPRERGASGAVDLHDADTWGTAAWGTPAALAHLYNETTPKHLPAVETLSIARIKKAQALLKQFPDRQWWVEVFEEFRHSAFLSGLQKPGLGHEHWRATFDWLLRQSSSGGTENAVKVHDGVYRNG